jgi:hypothetical protein
MGAPEPQVVSIGTDHCVATWQGFVIQIWRHGTSVEQARAVRAAARKLAQTREGALATIILIESGAAMPEAAARAELAGMAKDQATRMLRAAVAQEGRGFAAAAIRSIMIGMMLVAQNPFPHKVVASVGEACAWLATDPRLPREDVAALAAVVEGLRARIA